MDDSIVLVVDDNDDNLDLIEDALSDKPFSVLRAQSGPDAMALLMSNRVDLLILDLLMPDMNGFAVLEMVRSIPRLMDMSVIVQTAHGDHYNSDRARELGVKSILQKPISPAQLVEEVRNCLVEC